MNELATYWEKRLQYFGGKGIDLLSPATEEALILAESKLSCSLSPQHREFLRKFNGGRILEIHLYGVPRPDIRRGIPNRIDIVSNNLEFWSHEWWPKSWLRIGKDGFGNYFISDLSRRSPTGEYPVLFVDHETLGGDFGDISSSDFAPDYFGYLGKIVDEMIQLYTPEGHLKSISLDRKP